MTYPIDVSVYGDDAGVAVTCREALVRVVSERMRQTRRAVLSNSTRSVAVLRTESEYDPFGPDYVVRTQKTLISKRLLATDDFCDAIKCAIAYLSATGHA